MVAAAADAVNDQAAVTVYLGPTIVVIFLLTTNDEDDDLAREADPDILPFQTILLARGHAETRGWTG